MFSSDGGGVFVCSSGEFVRSFLALAVLLPGGKEARLSLFLLCVALVARLTCASYGRPKAGSRHGRFEHCITPERLHPRGVTVASATSSTPASHNVSFRCQEAVFWQDLKTLPLLVKASLLPHLPITLSQPLAGLDQLDDVDDLLKSHDREADRAEDPRHGAIHLVGAGVFHCGGGEGRGEERRGFGHGGRAGYEGEWLAHVAAVRRQETGGYGGRGEAEEVEGDEEELV